MSITIKPLEPSDCFLDALNKTERELEKLAKKEAKKHNVVCATKSLVDKDGKGLFRSDHVEFNEVTGKLEKKREISISPKLLSTQKNDDVANFLATLNGLPMKTGMFNPRSLPPNIESKNNPRVLKLKENEISRALGFGYYFRDRFGKKHPFLKELINSIFHFNNGGLFNVTQKGIIKFKGSTIDMDNNLTFEDGIGKDYSELYIQKIKSDSIIYHINRHCSIFDDTNPNAAIYAELLQEAQELEFENKLSHYLFMKVLYTLYRSKFLQAVYRSGLVEIIKLQGVHFSNDNEHFNILKIPNVRSINLLTTSLNIHAAQNDDNHQLVRVIIPNGTMHEDRVQQAARETYNVDTVSELSKKNMVKDKAFNKKDGNLFFSLPPSEKQVYGEKHVFDDKDLTFKQRIATGCIATGKEELVYNPFKHIIESVPTVTNELWGFGETGLVESYKSLSLISTLELYNANFVKSTKDYVVKLKKTVRAQVVAKSGEIYDLLDTNFKKTYDAVTRYYSSSGAEEIDKVTAKMGNKLYNNGGCFVSAKYGVVDLLYKLSDCLSKKKFLTILKNNEIQQHLAPHPYLSKGAKTFLFKNYINNMINAPAGATDGEIALLFLKSLGCSERDVMGLDHEKVALSLLSPFTNDFVSFVMSKKDLKDNPFKVLFLSLVHVEGEPVVAVYNKTKITQKERNEISHRLGVDRMKIPLSNDNNSFNAAIKPTERSLSIPDDLSAGGKPACIFGADKFITMRSSDLTEEQQTNTGSVTTQFVDTTLLNGSLTAKTGSCGFSYDNFYTNIYGTELRNTQNSIGANINCISNTNNKIINVAIVIPGNAECNETNILYPLAHVTPSSDVQVSLPGLKLFADVCGPEIKNILNEYENDLLNIPDDVLDILASIGMISIGIRQTFTSIVKVSHDGLDFYAINTTIKNRYSQ